MICPDISGLCSNNVCSKSMKLIDLPDAPADGTVGINSGRKL